jgi:ABC-type amino acid transport system permease subunit
MSGIQRSISDSIRAWNENGRLYLWGGVLAAIISWLLLPIIGLISVFCGYRLYEMNRGRIGGVIAIVGGLGVLVWLVLVLG